MAGKRTTQPQPHRGVERILRFDGGLNTDHPGLLESHEASVARNLCFDQRGTLASRPGVRARYTAAFAADPVTGLAPFYKSDGTTRLVAAAGSKLYYDVPHVLFEYDSQADWETGERFNVSSTQVPGSVKLLFPAGPTPRDTLVLQPAPADLDDAYVDEQYPSSNYGSEMALPIGGSPDDYRHRGLVRFNLSAYAGMAIDNATLSLYCYSEADTTDRDVRVHKITAAWNESLVTWSNQPTYDSSPSATTTITGIGWFSWAITTLVQLWLQGAANYGIMVVNYSENVASSSKNFRSSDYSTPSYRPKLSLTGPFPYFNTGRFGQALVVTSTTTLKFPTGTGAISAAKGTLECYVKLSRAPGTTEQTVFDGAGATNRNLQVAVKTNGHLVLRYGTGSATVEIEGTTALSSGTWYGVEFRWSSAGCVLFLNGAPQVSAATAPDLAFGSYAYLGTRADASCPLDGLLDDACISAQARPHTEVLARYTAQAEFTWDEYTSYLLHFNGDVNLPAGRKGSWISPAQNASAAADKSTLRVTWVADCPSGTGVSCQVRTSPDGATWSAWYDQGNGEVSSAPPNTYSQVRFILQTTAAGTSPDLQSAVASYDAQPTMAVLAQNMHSGAPYSMVTAMDYLVIGNGYDDLRKWDGTIPPPDPLPLVGGNPPKAALLAWHQNRVWAAGDLACPSRVRYGDVLDIDSWPVLNFIDVARDDGDTITGILPYEDYLVITKQNSIHTLAGYSSDTFTLKRWETNLGCLAPGSLCAVDGALAFVAREGIMLWNAGQRVSVTAKVTVFWREGVNHRRLAQAAGLYFDRKLLVALPAAESTTDDLVVIYDAARGSITVVDAARWAASCWTVFRQYGGDLLLHGSAVEGQLYEHLPTLLDDGGDAILPQWRSKAFDFGAPERSKWARQVVIEAACGPTERTLDVGFGVDGAAPTAYQELTVPASSTPRTTTFQVLPAAVGARFFRTLAVELRTDGDPLEVHSVVLEAVVRGEHR